MTSKPSQKIPLGRLEKVDLRTCWSEEGSEFTLWLAQSENIEMLGEAIGMELEVVAQSQSSTPNILCQDSEGGSVLIAHQLEATDSTHLGQLLAAMASLQAGTVIWVAGSFTAEHKSALTWLNQTTLPEFYFFGIEIELWRIGKSVAPKFNLVVEPTEWEEMAELEPEAAEEPLEEEPEPEPEPLTEKQLQNLEFWGGLCHQLERRGSIVKPSDPSIESEMSFAIGRAGFRLYTQINEEANCMSSGLLLSGEDAKPHFHLLQEEQEAIESEVGIPLEWNAERNGKGDDKNCSIYCVLTEVDFADRQRWSDYYQWLCLYLEQFHEVFSDRVKHLNANHYQPLPDYSFNPLKPSAILPSSTSDRPPQPPRLSS